jgi:RimJ/RimL family protein N-acetyltransferase
LLGLLAHGASLALADNSPMSSPDWLTKPTLTGSLVLLRPFVLADVDAVRAILADPEVRKLTGSVHAPDTHPPDTHRPHTQVTHAPDDRTLDDAPEDDERLHEWYSTRATVDERLDLAVIDRVSGELVGEVVLNEWEPDNASCNFRTLIGPAGRDRGLGTEATRLILAYGFEVLGLHRISLDVFSFNPRARRVYEKVGFVVEGVAREAFRWEEQWIDEIWMSILDREWAVHHGFPDASRG